MYCVCVNVYRTTATGCQPNCSCQIYHIIKYHIVQWGQSVTAVFDVTRAYNLLQYFDIMPYTIILLYLVCPSLLVAVDETSYGIQVGFIGFTQSSLFVYIFISI
jgi:hypothetical protein